MDWLDQVLRFTGASFVPFFVLGATLVAVCLERALAIGRARRRLAGLAERVSALIAQTGEIDAAVSFCTAQGGALGRVLCAGLLAAPRSLGAARVAMDAASGVERARLKRRIGLLRLIAVTGVLVGVLGAIIEFVSISFHRCSEDIPHLACLALRWSESFGPAAVGLVISALALAAHRLFATAHERTSGELDAGATRVHRVLAELAPYARAYGARVPIPTASYRS